MCGCENGRAVSLLKKTFILILVPSQVHACVFVCAHECEVCKRLDVFLVVSQEGGNLFFFFGATDSALKCVRTRCLHNILNNCFTSVQRARMCSMHHSAQHGLTFMVSISTCVCGWLYLSLCMGFNKSLYLCVCAPSHVFAYLQFYQSIILSHIYVSTRAHLHILTVYSCVRSEICVCAEPWQLLFATCGRALHQVCRGSRRSLWARRNSRRESSKAESICCSPSVGVSSLFSYNATQDVCLNSSFPVIPSLSTCAGLCLLFHLHQPLCLEHSSGAPRRYSTAQQ